MILSQLKRDGKGTDFEYRETSEIENVSDICIDLVYTDDTDIAKASPERLIKISKNKIGIKGQVYTTTINDCFLFSELQNKNFLNFSKQKHKTTKYPTSQEDVWDDVP